MKIFGHPKNILLENGGESDNKDFHEFCKSLHIIIKATAPESPKSDGLVERHNNIIGEQLAKLKMM